MNPRLVFALAVAALLVAFPSGSAGIKEPQEGPPMLVINHLDKSGGPVFYVDWDGTIYKEANKKTGLQRTEKIYPGEGVVKADVTDLLA